jgi:WD40 repeat protein
MPCEDASISDVNMTLAPGKNIEVFRPAHTQTFTETATPTKCSQSSRSILITAFSWHPESFMVGMTLSNGQVCLGVIDTEDDSNEPTKMEVASHDLKAWTLAFLPDGSGLMSGRDDSMLRFAELADSSTGSVPWMDWKIHGAGVTAILPIHLDSEGGLVVTGSYDDHIRLLHVPISAPKVQCVVIVRIATAAL